MEGFIVLRKRYAFGHGFEDILQAHGLLDAQPASDFDLMQSCGPKNIQRNSPSFVPSDPAKTSAILEALERALRTGLDRARLERRIAKLETEVKDLKAIKRQATQDCLPVSRSLAIPISTFAPEPYELSNPIQILIQYSNETFTASFLDANVNASGDTEAEALEEIKYSILNMFDRLVGLDDSKLGPGPRKQKNVLQSLIKRR